LIFLTALMSHTPMNNVMWMCYHGAAVNRKWLHVLVISNCLNITTTTLPSFIYSDVYVFSMWYFPKHRFPWKAFRKLINSKKLKKICAFNKLINFYTTSCVSNCMTLSGNWTIVMTIWWLQKCSAKYQGGWEKLWIMQQWL